MHPLPKEANRIIFTSPWGCLMGPMGVTPLHFWTDFWDSTVAVAAVLRECSRAAEGVQSRGWVTKVRDRFKAATKRRFGSYERSKDATNGAIGRYWAYY